MELSPSLQIATILKAMSDVVMPAVDRANKPAVEQAQLIIGMLQLLAQRQPLVYRYERTELESFLALSSTLHNHARDMPGAAGALEAMLASSRSGADVLDRSRADPGELTASNLALRASISALVAVMYADADASALKHVSACVNAHAREQLLRERAWLAPQGWEADPAALPAIETLI